MSRSKAGENHVHARASLPTLALGALGVVFGAIGTSPLFAIDQIFFGAAHIAPTRDNVIGALSLAIWALILIVSVNYAVLTLRAQNEGEGGLFALYGLLHPFKTQGARPVLWALMLGAGLLFGDGMISPAISGVLAFSTVTVPSFATSSMRAVVGAVMVVETSEP